MSLTFLLYRKTQQPEKQEVNSVIRESRIHAGSSSTTAKAKTLTCAARACPSSARSPPMQTDETTHPATTPQLSYPGSFPPRKSVGAHSDSLGESRCGSYGMTRSSRGFS